MAHRSLGALVLVLALVAIPKGQASEAMLKVETAQGPVLGMLDETEENIRVFKGIPYAKPPIGELRWRLPQVPEKRENALDATAFAARCSQGQGGGFYAQQPAKISEDCLYLNIWTAARDGESLPVMVWIHGGAFVMGSAMENFYDGANFAQSGVVLVSINYRLGLAGFFAHPALKAEAGQVVANQGIYDQLAALAWVQENIAKFGGDPSNVTIFGESAGSMSVCYLVATPLAEGLFHKAIGQSGGCFSKHPTVEESIAERDDESDELAGSGFAAAERIATALGAESNDEEGLAKLRSMTWIQMQAALSKSEISAPWRSIYVDGAMFPDQMRTLIAGGKGNPVPVLVGSNTDEGTTLFQQMPEVSLDEWKSGLRAEMGKSAERFISAYLGDAQESTKKAAQQMLSDSIFAWEMRTWAQLNAARELASFLYVFSYAPPVPGFERNLGAYHAGEIAYAFKNGNELWNDEDRTLADVIHRFWVNFAKTGDPNGEGLPAWPRYETEADVAMDLKVEAAALPKYRVDKLDAWEMQNAL